MEKQNPKLYGTILFGLNVISTLVMLWTLFVPLFKVELGLIQEEFTLWDYLFSSEYEKAELFQLLSTQNGIGYFWNMALYLCGVFCIVGVVTSAIGLVSDFKKLEKKKVIHDLWDRMTVGLFINGIYLVISCIIFMVYFDADIFECFTGELYTQTYIPLLFQGILFLAAWFVYTQWKNTQNSSEEISTLELLQRYKKLLDAKAMSQETFELKKAELLYGQPPSEEEKNLSDAAKAGLLAKYKELLDSGIITEGEYNLKKEMLLFGEKKV